MHELGYCNGKYTSITVFLMAWVALRCSHCFFKSSGHDKLELKHQNVVLQAYRMHYSKNMSSCETQCKICAIGETESNEIWSLYLGGQRIDQKRKKGWWRGRRERIEKGSTERIEIERKETKK